MVALDTCLSPSSQRQLHKVECRLSTCQFQECQHAVLTPMRGYQFDSHYGEKTENLFPWSATALTFPPTWLRNITLIAPGLASCHNWDPCQSCDGFPAPIDSMIIATDGARRDNGRENARSAVGVFFCPWFSRKLTLRVRYHSGHISNGPESTVCSCHHRCLQSDGHFEETRIPGDDGFGRFQDRLEI